jgi:hypothetical protein
MANLVHGTASAINLGSDYSYAATANHGPVAIKNQLVSLRIDNKPVLFKTRTLPSISEGDRVAVVGTDKNGTLEAVALRNLTTGAGYYMPTVMPMVLAAVLVVIGLPLIPFLGIGLLFVGFGGWILYKGYSAHTAINQLKAFQP